MNNDLTSSKMRLSVIDDHPIIFLGIQLALRKNKACSIEFVNSYMSGQQVLHNLDNLNSDVLLIDLCLPDMKGYDLAKKILEAYPEMKIGIYSSMRDKESIVKSFKCGALGYLPKSASGDEIIDFLQTIGKGERYVRGVIADIIFDAEQTSIQLFNITKRETEILQLILKGLKNREIAEKLNIAERTVEFHKQNIYIKLEVNNLVDLYKAAKRLNMITESN